MNPNMYLYNEPFYATLNQINNSLDPLIQFSETARLRWEYLSASEIGIFSSVSEFFFQKNRTDQLGSKGFPFE